MLESAPPEAIVIAGAATAEVEIVDAVTAEAAEDVTAGAAIVIAVAVTAIGTATVTVATTAVAAVIRAETSRVDGSSLSKISLSPVSTTERVLAALRIPQSA